MRETLTNYWHVITPIVAGVNGLIVLAMIAWILAIKKESTSAIAWCLLVILVPLFGALLFVMFGYQSVQRPLIRKKRHRRRYREKHVAPTVEAPTANEEPDPGYEGLGVLAAHLNASLPIVGNRVAFFHEGRSAFQEIFAAIEAAQHHVHVQFFIFRTDDLGKRLLALLAAKARSGVEVRLLTDGVGARKFRRAQAKPVIDAGGKWGSFLPVSLWRRRVQVNLRNHRKIVVVDGQTAFTGGLNVGDEYLGLDPHFGFWRDTFLRLDGPAAQPVQRVFCEDWDFATGETLRNEKYFPTCEPCGDATVQVIASGPDEDLKGIREIYFAAMLRSRKRLWVTSPYYVPDQGMRDALCLAARSGADVRLLLPQNPDHWMPYFAARYYLPDVLAAGVRVYHYAKGFIHAKVVLVDGKWASVGSANLDNRSLLLNFEMNCLFHTPRVVAELEQQFLSDLEDSHSIDAKIYAKRNWPGRLAENVCRLFAPVL